MGASVQQTGRSARRTLWLYALIVVALAARVGWAAWIAHAHPVAVTSADTAGYLAPARAFIHSGHFNLSPANSTPIFVRTPGYPAVLAAILWVTNSRWAISPIQATLSILTVVVAFFVGRRLLGPTAGLVAALLVALDPLQFALSGTILTESLTSLLLIGAVAIAAVVFVRRRERVSLRYVVALAVTLALATMFRPTMWFFPLVVLALLAVHFRGLPLRRLLTVCLAFALPIVAVVGGWQVRNHYAVHSWQVSGTAGIVLYCYNAAAVEAKVDGTSVTRARRTLGCAPNGFDLAVACPSFWACHSKHPLADGHGFDQMSSKGVHILSGHPVQTTEVALSGAVREIFGPGTDTVGQFLHLSSTHLLAVPLFVWNLLLWLFAIVGAVVGVRSRLRVFWIFVVALVAYVIILSMGAEAYARFRTPIVPLLALLAAYGIRSIVTARRAVPAGS